MTRDETMHMTSAATSVMPEDRVAMEAARKTAVATNQASRAPHCSAASSFSARSNVALLKRKYGMSENTLLDANRNQAGDDMVRRQIAHAAHLPCVRRRRTYVASKPAVANTTIA